MATSSLQPPMAGFRGSEEYEGFNRDIWRGYNSVFLTKGALSNHTGAQPGIGVLVDLVEHTSSLSPTEGE